MGADIHSKTPCTLFNSAEGCKFGDSCRFSHMIQSKTACSKFNTAEGCKFGDSCQFSHAISPQASKKQVNSYINTNTFSYTICRESSLTFINI